MAEPRIINSNYSPETDKYFEYFTIYRGPEDEVVKFVIPMRSNAHGEFRQTEASYTIRAIRPLLMEDGTVPDGGGTTLIEEIYQFLMMNSAIISKIEYSVNTFTKSVDFSESAIIIYNIGTMEKMYNNCGSEILSIDVVRNKGMV